MSWVATAVTVVSAAVSIYAGHQAAEAAEDTAAFNAAAARQRAMEEQEVAAENARRREKEAARMVARQRAALAGSGLAMEGTPLAVLGDAYSQSQMDVGDISYQAKQRSRALEVSAGMSLARGENEATALRLRGYGQALGSVAGTTRGFLQ